MRPFWGASRRCREIEPLACLPARSIPDVRDRFVIQNAAGRTITSPEMPAADVPPPGSSRPALARAWPTARGCGP